MAKQLDFTIKERQVWLSQVDRLVFITDSNADTSRYCNYLQPTGDWLDSSNAAFIDMEQAEAFARRFAPLTPTVVAPGKNKQLAAILTTDESVPNVARWVINAIKALHAGAGSETIERRLSFLSLENYLRTYEEHTAKDDPLNSGCRRQLVQSVRSHLQSLLKSLELDQPQIPWTQPTTIPAVNAMIESIVRERRWLRSCRHCGLGTREPERGGYYICLCCKHHYYKKCHACKKNQWGEDMTSVRIRDGGERKYCEGCVPADLQVCTHCSYAYTGGPFHGHNIRAEELAELFPQGLKYCPNCARTLRRLDCQHIFMGNGFEQLSYMRSIEDDEAPPEESRESRRVCENCRQQARDIDFSPTFWPADPAITLVTGKGKDEVGSERTFGVELEYCQAAGIKKLPKKIARYWNAKPDASLPRSGVELASIILQGGAGLKVIEDLTSYAATHKWAVNQRAGMHVHFGLPDETPEQLAAIAIGYLLSTDVWRSFVAPSRKTCKHCADFSKPPDFYAQMEAKNILPHLTDGEGTERDSHGNGSGRRRWINWFSYRHYRTVELRVHQGTNSYEKISNWIKAHCRFIDWCASVGDHQEIFKRMSPYRDNAHAMFLAINRWAWKDWELGSWFRDRALKFDDGLLRIRPKLADRKRMGAIDWIPTPACARQQTKIPRPSAGAAAERRLRLAAGMPANIWEESIFSRPAAESPSTAQLATEQAATDMLQDALIAERRRLVAMAAAVTSIRLPVPPRPPQTTVDTPTTSVVAADVSFWTGPQQINADWVEIRPLAETMNDDL